MKFVFYLFIFDPEITLMSNVQISFLYNLWQFDVSDLKFKLEWMVCI